MPSELSQEDVRVDHNKFQDQSPLQVTFLLNAFAPNVYVFQHDKHKNLQYL